MGVTPKRSYRFAGIAFLVLAVAFFIRGDTALGASFLALGIAFIAIGNSKDTPESGAARAEDHRR
jgi:hypothetical protein